MTTTPDPDIVRECAEDAIRRAVAAGMSRYIEATLIARGGAGRITSERFEVYTNAVAGEVERIVMELTWPAKDTRARTNQPDEQHDSGACEGCGCCTRTGCHRFADLTCPTDLRAFLTATVGEVLVEASPYDRVWGIGVAASHRDVRDPSAWPGLNLLGFALMRVREQLS